MQTYLEWVIQIFRMANGGNRLWVVYPCALLYLLIFEKKLRFRLALPSVLLTLLVVNPFLAKLFDMLGVSVIYWRTFWLIPIIPVLAATAVSLVSRLKKGGWKIALTLLLCVGIAVSGSYVYADRHEFTARKNAYRIDPLYVEVAETLLSLDEEPYVIATPYLGVGLRQVSSRIHQLYGRNFYGFISPFSEEDARVAYEVEKQHPDLDFLGEVMRERGYRYLVLVRENAEITDEIAASSGFTKAAECGRYDIWELTRQGV